jgi:serine acetyltransferase
MTVDPKAKEMMSRHELHGKPSPDKIGKPLAYFALRGIFLDCRGPLKIHPESEWGWHVMVLTRSHDVSGGAYSQKRVDRPVTVEEGAWIGSRAILYNCHIKHHAIVACGAVVRNMVVEPHTIVEGNPAVVTRRYVGGEWVSIERQVCE